MSAEMQDLQAALGSAYTLERELGGGGMSRVFVATETGLGRTVVVKVLDVELSGGASTERFAREVRLAARLQQANIVPVLSAGVAGGVPWYTMPFVRGESLRARLLSGRPIPLSTAVNILRDVARALAFAHDEGVVHRDIKPENILLSGAAAVVTDFGIAKAISVAQTSDSTAPETLTKTGHSIGTPAYMAPEQVAGDPSVDHRADLYAWGIVAWEVLGGRHPFADRTSAQSLAAAHLTSAPPTLSSVRPDIPRSLDQLVLQCLGKEATSRPASANDLLAALDEVTASSGLTSQQTTGRGINRWAAGALLGAVAIAAVAWTWQARWSGAPGRVEIAPSPTLAVLPFTAPGGDSVNVYFAEGMADEVATSLAKVPGLRLASRSSAASRRGEGTPQEIGKALGVGSILQGSVRRTGDRMRVSVELTNTADGIVLWTESYERQVQDAFAVQDDISREIVSALRVTLGQGSAASPTSERGTANVAAYDDYLRGMYFYQRRGAGIPRAVEAFSAAIAKDSNFARAYAGLGLSLTTLTIYGNTPKDKVLGRAMAAAEHAVQLDPTLADAYLAIAMAYLYDGRWDKVEPPFQRAIALDSTLALAHLFYGRYLWAVGRVGEAIAQGHLAQRFDPLSAAALGNLGLFLTAAGRSDEAIRAARAGYEMDTTVLPAMVGYAQAVAAGTNRDEARSLGERLLRYTKDLQAMGSAAYAIGRSGDTARARVLYGELLKRRGEWRIEQALVRAASGIGDTTLQLEALEAGVASGEPLAVNLAFVDPMYDALRGSPRFLAVIRATGLDPARFVKPRP